MSFNIKKYNGKPYKKKDNEYVFWVQCVGMHSGRPLKNPIPNSWEVTTKRKIDFQILYCIYISKILQPFIIGSVIPFLRITDYKNIIMPVLANAINNHEKINEKYLQIETIEQNIENKKKIIQLLQQMREITALQITKTLKKENAI